MREPFTPEIVHGLLSAAMKGSQRGPYVKSDKVKRLTRALNRMQQVVTHCRDQLPEETKRATDVAKAIGVLIEEAPKLRGEYAVALDDLKRWTGDESTCPPQQREEWTDRARRDLEALDALVAAAKVAREQRIPLPPIMLLDDRAERWRTHATSLMDAFKEATGGSAEAGYRFIAAVVPRLTGEGTTPEAVKIELIRQRARSRSES